MALLQRFIVLTSIHIIYTFCGALIFMRIEECTVIRTDNKEYEKLLNHIKNSTDLNNTEKEIMVNMIKNISKPKSDCFFGMKVIMKWWKFTVITCAAIGKTRSTFFINNSK